MPSLLDNLDRDAAVMLYLAGELATDDRAAFERRLAGDADLAADVERLRAAGDAVNVQLAHADAHARLPTGESVAVRRVSRSINQWLAQRDARPAEPARRNVAVPWWSYPSAAAAILIIGFLVWSSRQEVGPVEASPEARQKITAMDAEQQDLAEWMASSLDTNAYASADTEVDRLLSAGGRRDDIRPVMLEEVSQ